MAEQLVTVYITPIQEAAYAAHLDGDETSARTVSAGQWAAWRSAQAAWNEAQAQMATVYRSSGF